MSATAIVTGGTGGLGAAVVERLLSDGWTVVVPWRTAAETGRLERHDRLRLVEADLFDPQAVREVVAVAGDDLAALVNLVGGYAEGGRIHETPIEEFEAQLRLNLRPTYLMTAQALPALLRRQTSAVVCVSSRAALKPFPGAAGYITAKAAVLAFVDALDAEYRAKGVRANAIVPSVVDTPANRASMSDADFSRWVRPEQIAAVVAGLIADDGEAVTGTHVKVYGRA